MADGRGDRHVALLRGINVGRAKRVAMADLCEVVTGLGYGGVRTVLQSGNVVFTAAGPLAPDAAVRLQEELARRTGVTAAVVLLAGPQFADVVAQNPLVGIASDPSRLMVAFLSDPADRDRLAELLDRSWAPEVLAVGERAAYLWCPEGLLASRLNDAVGAQRLAGVVTTRNWRTVTRIDALLG